MDDCLDDIILLAHGAGGRKSADLLQKVFLKHFANPVLNTLADSAVLECGGNFAFTTDSFVVYPLFFPGGDIGKLAVCGTINDLAAVGAWPLAISAAFIIEEGFDFQTLERIVASMAATAREAGTPIVAGDTKVVPRGSADKIFITTSGVGAIPPGVHISPENAAPGDVVLVSGTVGDHGMAVMAAREGIAFSSEIISDCAPLHTLARRLVESAEVHCLRDPTRGGLASALNEIATQSRVCIEVREPDIPLNENVRIACELLGLDPLYSANEGKLLAIVPEAQAHVALKTMQEHPAATRAAVIGRVTESPPGQVHLRTALGSLRVLDMPSGNLLPRIC